VQFGHGLARIEQGAGVERGLHFVETRQFRRGELRAHLVDFLQTDAVFARDGAADFDAQFENPAAETLGLVQFARLVGVEQDQRVEVAIAGVEHVGDGKPVFGAHLADALQHVRQLRTRDGAVHAVVVRRQPPHRRKRRLAPGPEPEALRLAVGGSDLGGAGGFEHFAHGKDVVRDFLVDPVYLAQQQRFAVERIACVNEGLGGLDGEAVHHLQPGGDDAGGNDVADRGAGLGHVVEGREHHLRALGARQQFHGDFGDHGQHAFRAGHERQQVVAGGIERLAADFEQLAGDGPCAQLEDVVHGQAIFEAVHATGVFRHVAADRTGDLRRGIGRVIQVMRGGGLGNRQIAYPRLDHGGARQRVDILDLIELGQHQQHGAVDRQGAGGEAGAGTAGHHRHLFLVAQPQDRRHLRLVFRQHHHIGGIAIRR